MMEILIDFNHPRGIIKQVQLDNGEVWKLLGNCRRCGICCETAKMPIKEFQTKDGTCKHFEYETVNDEKLGKCNIIWTRPTFCTLYPQDPYAKLTKGCSFSWERIK